MNVKFFHCILIGALLFFACSSSQFGWKPDSDTDRGEDENTGMIEDFDPLSLNEEEIQVLEEPKTGPSNEQETVVLPVKDDTVEEEQQGEMIDGYRVQLLAIEDETKARDEKRKAIFRFEEDVYLLFISPLWKLRVGNCETRGEAEVLLERAKQLGFHDNNPFIVRSKVYRQRKSDVIE